MNPAMTYYSDTENDVQVIIDPIKRVEEEEEKEIVNKGNLYTVMCANFLKGYCRRDKKCTYAHSLEQFNPHSCRADALCTNFKTCKYLHTCEDKEEYCNRLNIILPDIRHKQTQIKSAIIRTTKERAHEDLDIALNIGNKYFTFIIE